MINIPCLEYSENIHIITFTVSQPHKPNRIFILFYISLKNYLRLGCKHIYPAASDEAYIILLHHKGLWLSIEVHVYSIPDRRGNQWPRCVCLRPKKIKGIRTGAEVECIEARTPIKAGAPVCSGSLLCSLPNEPRIYVSRRVCEI